MTRNSRIDSNGLKRQLQVKSAKRRSRKAAETRIEAAACHHGRNDLQPELRTVTRRVGALEPSPNRTRETTPEQLERVISSIQRFGLVMPVLIDVEDRIVHGHIVWEAAAKLDFESIQCLVIEHLDPLEIEALGIALNRLGETGSWDLDALRDRMIEIRSGGIELTNTGFTIPEIDQILLDPAPAEDCGEEEADEGDDDCPPVTMPGDLFQLGRHTLVCGDALEEESYTRVLDGRKANGAFSDPPYNCPIAGFASGLGQYKHGDFQIACGEMDDGAFARVLATYLSHCRSFTSEGAIIFACMDWRQIDLLLFAGRVVGLTRNNVCAWDKGAGGMTGSIYRSRHELVAVFVNGKTPATNNVALGAYGRDRANVWAYPGANRKGSSAAEALADHPTPKPVELVEDALLDVTKPGDVVLDPFAGGGVTIIAAERCDRIACAIELDPKYVDRSIRRWERLTGKDAIHVETGVTFAELARSRNENFDQ